MYSPEIDWFVDYEAALELLEGQENIERIENDGFKTVDER